MFKLNLEDEAKNLAGTKARDADFCILNIWANSNSINSFPKLPRNASIFSALVGLQQKAQDLMRNVVNSAGQTVQKGLDQVTEAGQKVVDDACKAAQDTGEKAAQSLTSQVTAWGKAFGQSEEQKNVST